MGKFEMDANKEKQSVIETAGKMLSSGVEGPARAYWEGFLKGANEKMDEDYAGNAATTIGRRRWNSGGM